MRPLASKWNRMGGASGQNAPASAPVQDSEGAGRCDEALQSSSHEVEDA